MSKNAIRQKQEVSYLLLGANLGNPKRTFVLAREQLADLGQITKVSSLYITEAWGVQNQESYFNQVIEFKTQLKPNALLSLIHKVENSLGRVRSSKWSERTIDIDILLYGTKPYKTDKLIIPHALLHERLFALQPLAEILPNYTHPTLNKTISDLLHETKDTSWIRLEESGRAK